MPAWPVTPVRYAAIVSAACPPPIAMERPVKAAPAARISMAATSPVRSPCRTVCGRLRDSDARAPVPRTDPTRAPAAPMTRKVIAARPVGISVPGPLMSRAASTPRAA
jgi:hypothetical protein